MPRVKIKCDRCNKEVDGIETDTGTVGFYRLSGCWAEYKRNEEEAICDECMWIDPKYIRNYPRMLFKEKDGK